jgi:hypothetical protein
MNEEQRKNLRERRVRYETLRRKQLGTAINLLLGLSTAGVGFCVSRVVDKDSHFSNPGTCLFLVGLLTFVVAVGCGVCATCTRLWDFRLTVTKIQSRIEGDRSKISKWGRLANRLGRWTWCLFWTQSGFFLVGILLLAASLSVLNQDHLFPHVEKVTLLNGTSVTPYVITGKYSVDEAAHVKQMADCKADLTRFVDEINSNTRKPGDTLLLDPYDAAFLRGHICANYAAEPLDKPSREVIEGLTNLDSLMMASERLRYENVKGQLDYYQKKLH